MGRWLSRYALLGMVATVLAGVLLPLSPFDLATANETSNKITSNGLTVEFAARAAMREGGADKIVAGQPVEIRFKITDAATGAAFSNARPGVWVDARKKTSAIAQRSGEADAKDPCREKIGYFLQGGLTYRPDIDLNAWYILSLNRKASITVIDPLLGYGGQRIVTLILLNSPGEDWVMGRDGRSLFVALPTTAEVAVIDTATWKVTANIKVGVNPVRLVLQQDGRYLWVGHDGGVSIIDTERREVVKGIATGAGRHDIALGKRDDEAFVSNPAEGTVSRINVGTLNTVATITVGGSPGAMAYSTLAGAAYVADAKTGLISAIDPSARKVTATMQAKPGLYALQFTPDGRWGLSANPLANEVVVFDASTNRITNTIEVEGAPDQVAIGSQFAYVRATGKAEISLIALDSLGPERRPFVKTISGGDNAPLADASLPASAPVIVPTPDRGTVLVANPTDKTIYFYSEGMNAPMGSFPNMRRELRAALAVERSLRETEPGIYTAHLQLPAGGDYDVAFHTSSPPVSHCFTVTAEQDPALTARSAKPYRLEFLSEDRDFAAGEPARVQFRLVNPATGSPFAGLTDLEVQVFLVPGTWRVQQQARSLGDGVYEVAIELPRSGVYYLHVASRSLRARYNDLPSLVLRAHETRVRDMKG
jgi:YVTN family beta-propeller protein